MMKLENIKSAELLPRFAHAISWVMDALDRAVKYINGRANSIDAPLTLESIQALTDNELEALYKELGVAEYYPDLTRETRDRFLFELARAYRYLGTPHAVELLCQYIFDDTPIEVEVDDNRAWDSSGHLVDENLLDTFSVQVTPDSLDATPEQHARILANIIRFSRNSQALESIYYNFESSFDLPVYPVALGRACAETTYGESPCVPIPGIPVGGTIDTDSQTVLYMPRVGGAMEIGDPVRNPKDFTLQTDSVPLDLGGAVIPGEPVRNPKDFELSGSMPMDGGTVSEDVSIEVDLIIEMYRGYEQMKGAIGTSDMCLANCMTQADADAVHAIGLETYGYATMYGCIGQYGAILYNPAYRFEILWFHTWYGETQIPATNAIYVGAINYTLEGESEPKAYFGLRLASGVNAYFFYADGHDPTDSSYSTNSTSCKYYHVKITRA